MSYTYLKSPDDTVYKVDSGGDSYTFFSGRNFTASGGYIVNYGVAQNIINNTVNFSVLPDSSVFDQTAQTTIDSLQNPITDYVNSGFRYFQYTTFVAGVSLTTYYAIQEEVGIFDFTNIVEAVTNNDGTLEYSILRINDATYRNNLLNFFANNGTKSDFDLHNSAKTKAFSAITSGGAGGAYYYVAEEFSFNGIQCISNENQYNIVSPSQLEIDAWYYSPKKGRAYYIVGPQANPSNSSIVLDDLEGVYKNCEQAFGM